jgi:hypothetical protein
MVETLSSSAVVATVCTFADARSEAVATFADWRLDSSAP